MIRPRVLHDDSSGRSTVNNHNFLQLVPARRCASAGTIATAPCLSVCLSQVGVLSKRINESGWFLACELPSTCLTLCHKKIQVSSKVRVGLLPSGTLLQTLDSRYRISIVEACYQFSSRKVDAQSVINWTVVGQLSIENTSQLQRSTTVVYRTECQALSTA